MKMQDNITISYLLFKSIWVWVSYFGHIPETHCFLNWHASILLAPFLHSKPYLFSKSEISIFIFIRSDNGFCVLFLFVHSAQFCQAPLKLVFNLSFLSLLFFLCDLSFFFNKTIVIEFASIIIQIFLNFNLHNF